ncbi:MAG: AAA family ATPase [Actinobacteria bacterium]|nr:AAA family ATPase [Actinomycetota bacterium]
MSVSRGALPLVERHRELTELETCLRSAVNGIGAAVSIVGPAGIGKTRLAAEALRTATELGFRCAWGAGWAEGGVPPLWPWQSVLSQLGCDDELLTAVAAQNDHERFTTFQRVAAAIAAVAELHPVLVVIDDVHTADPAAVLLARFLVRTMRASRAAFVVTCRAAGSDDDIGLGGEPLVDALGRDTLTLALDPLTVDGLLDLHDRLGIDAPIDRVREVLALTGGNPLFVGELLAAADASGITIGSVRTILQLRLHGLDDDAHTVLAAAALLGPLASTATTLAAAGIEPSRGSSLLRDARRAGVLVAADDDRCTFTHRLLADALIATRTPEEVAGLHERIAAELMRSDASAVEHVLATAHHRVAAARIRHDPASVAAATEACVRGAQALMAGFAYEAAAQLLARAVDLNEQHNPPTPIRLLLDVARTELAAGNLLAARAWFRRAAERADDPVDLAEAAVGLGGIWVHEHRAAADHAWFMALLRRGLAGLDDRHRLVRARLEARLAAEQVYTGHAPPADVERAVLAARATGDPLVLAEALSLWHHTMLGPANTGPARLRVADELVTTAASAGDDVLGLMGLLWRTIDLVLMGDHRAERALAEARERADALQVGAVLFVLDAIDVMRLLRAGQIDDAEQAARRCFETGTAIGDADAVGYLGGHLLTIRWLQDRPADILPLARSVAASPAMVEGDVAPLAAAAVLGAMIGEHEQARADLREVMSCAPRSAHTSSNWMVTMFCAAEAARLLDDLKTAESVYALLVPFRHLPILGSVGVVCLGSAERSLGVTAATLGDVNLAVHHFEQALEHNLRLQNHVLAAIGEGELGCALLDRASAGDVERGRSHIDAAVRALEGFGLASRAQTLRSEADRLLRSVPVPDGHVVRVQGGWRLEYGEHAVEVPDSVGVRRLHQLLACPFVDVPALQLAGDLGRVGASTTRQDVNDLPSLRAYRAHIDDLRSGIESAERDHDLERASQLRIELDGVLEHLRPTLGLAGHTRPFADPVERARVAVRKSLERVFDAIEHHDADLANHLRASIRTGAICRFEPADGFPSVWHVSA